MTEETVRTVVIAMDALEAIRTEVASSRPHLETGGILLGHQATGTTDLRITVAGDAGPNAIHERRRFLRDREHAQAVADAAWHKHRAMWIGEWHTHPDGGLLPSEVDLRSYLTHLHDPDLGFGEFLSVIVGAAEDCLVLAAWVVNQAEVATATLKVIGEEEEKTP